MKQLTDKVFAQVRDALAVAKEFCGSLTAEDCPDTVAVPINKALAALDAAQPVQVNAMLVEALCMWQALANGGAETSTIVDGCKTQTLAQYTTYLDRLEAVKKSTEIALTAAQQAQPERAPLSPELISHLAETHVGIPNSKYPLSESDWINFARAIEAAHAIKQGGQHD